MDKLEGLQEHQTCRCSGGMAQFPRETGGAVTSLLTGVVLVVIFLVCLSFCCSFFPPACLSPISPPFVASSLYLPSAVTMQLYPHHLRHEWKSSGPNRTIDKFNEAHVVAKKQLYSLLVSLLSVGLLFLRV